MNLSIFIDGASKGNPGQASIGVLIKDEQGNVVGKISQLIGEATNNAAEYYALIYALQEGLKLRAENLTVHTDSQLLHHQIKGIYRVKEPQLKMLHRQVLNLLEGFKTVSLLQIEREKNKEADKLANDAFKTIPPNVI